MMQALTLDDLMDIGDEQYERLEVEPAVAALRRQVRNRHLREAMPILRALAKCDGSAGVDEVEEETGLSVRLTVLPDIRPWVRMDGNQLWLTMRGQAIMREEAASYAQ